MSPSSEADWVVTIEQLGASLKFGAAELPITISSDPSADVRLGNLPGSIQIGRLGQVFFLQAGRNTRNLRVSGESVAGSRELKDGDVIAFDRARLTCRIVAGRLVVGTDVLVTAGDTAPPNLDELARGG